jgi:hypothetical protein
MKITKQQLKQIIKEELDSTMEEGAENLNAESFQILLNAVSHFATEPAVAAALAAGGLVAAITKIKEIVTGEEDRPVNLDEKIKEVPGGYKATTKSGRALSKEPKSRAAAGDQLAAVEISKKNRGE